MIAIVDYGSGNIQAIKNIFDNLKINCFFASTSKDLQKADKIILPGVGAFDETMNQLNESGMVETLNYLVLEKKVPVLGICVGMQVMAKKSEEGHAQGLGWFDASVNKFDVSLIKTKPKIPHMGWNEIALHQDSEIMHGISLEKGFYFIHSYYFECSNSQDILLTSTYGNEFTCAVHKENIFGFQFHPEKSHSNGITLFKNFASVNEC